MKALKTYECTVKNYFNSGEHLTETVVALSPSKARYQFYRNMDSDEPYKDWFKAIHVKSLGAMKPSDFFEDVERFNDICERRGMEFVRMGMTIDVAGKKGIVVGGNSSLNFNVIMEGTTHAQNCHPTWETTYYDKQMNVIKDFKKPKQ
jgi:hypothetical protein